MKRIAVIKKNKCNFTEMEKYAAPLLYRHHTDEQRKSIKKEINDYIWSVIEPYVTYVDIGPDDDFLTVMCGEMTKSFPDRKPDDFYYHTEASYTSPKKYMELVYCQPLWSGYKDAQPENTNNIGCLFSLKHHVIDNDCVIIANKYDLTQPKFASIGCVEKNDILRVVRRRFFFSAVLIQDDNMVKYYYQDPKYLITQVFKLTQNDNIEKLSLSHFKYNLVLYFQHNKQSYVNKIATRINGSYRLFGDVLVLHEMEENMFTNISIRECKRLNVLSYGRLYDRQLRENEIHAVDNYEVDENGKEVHKKITPLWSRYIVVENRMVNWTKNKNNCIYCEKEMKNPITCQKCYRARYCSQECVDAFKSYHFDECMNPYQ